MQVKIVDATQGQILRFMQERMGQHGLRPNTRKDNLVKKLAELYSEDFILVDDEDPHAGDAGPKSERPHYANPPKTKVDMLRFGALDPMVTIKIHADKAKDGGRNVPCHLNGVEYFIPRNKEVKIPYRYFRALEEAVGDIHDGWDDKEKRNSEARETQSYTYTVTRMPSDAEIEAWKKRMEPHLEKQTKNKMRRIIRTRQLREQEEAFGG